MEKNRDNFVLRLGKYRVRSILKEEIGAVTQMEYKHFGETAVPQECHQSWFQVYPEGFKVALDPLDKIVGYAMVIRLNKEEIKHNWYIDTNNGLCTNHNPNGEILYGVCCISEAANAGIALCLGTRYLTDTQIGLKEVWIYGRLIGFAKWKRKNALDEPIPSCLDKYVRLHHDPVQLFYESTGLTAVKGVDGYLNNDDASLESAALLKWVKVY